MGSEVHSHNGSCIYSVENQMGTLLSSLYQPSVTNFIWPYLHQLFDNSHGLNGYVKPLKRPFDQC